MIASSLLSRRPPLAVRRSAQKLVVNRSIGALYRGDIHPARPADKTPKSNSGPSLSSAEKLRLLELSKPHIPAWLCATTDSCSLTSGIATQYAKTDSGQDTDSRVAWYAQKDPPAASQLTLETMLATGMHLGHSSQHRNKRMLPFIFGTRAGIDIINLELSISYLRRACAVTRQVALNGGIIVFVGYHDDNLMVPPMVTKVAYRCGAYHVARRWTPGTITNARCTLQASISAEQAAGQSSSPLQHASRSMAFRPDLLLLLSSQRSQVAAKEASQMSIPTVGVVDTDGDPDCVTYPIPGNDDSLAASTLVAGILAQAVQDGKQHRERLLRRRELSRQSLMEQQSKDAETQSDTTRLLSATSLDDLELADGKE